MYSVCIGLWLVFLLVFYELIIIVSMSSSATAAANVCLKDFKCGSLGYLSFPFTDSSHPDCGLFLANCSSNPITISLNHQTNGRSYILFKILYNNSIRVLDTRLRDDLNQSMCALFFDSILDSAAISFTVEHNITMIICKNDDAVNNTSGMEPLKSLNNYTTCQDFTIYYRNPKDNDKPPSYNINDSLPPNCQRITLPMASIRKNPKLFGLLTPEFDLSWQLSDNCSDCLNGMMKGSQCDGDNTFCAIAGNHVPKGKSKSTLVIVIVVCIIIFLCVSLSLCILIDRRRRRRRKRPTEAVTQQLNEEEIKVQNAIDGSETKHYDFAIIRGATQDFSTANMLGRGGFGVVYKGVLSNGKEIAVKRLLATSGQGEKEFKNEVMLLAKLQHNCLVKLLGFCLQQTERLLVYQFMANGSLDKILFGKNKFPTPNECGLNIRSNYHILSTESDEVKRSRLDWDRRYKIIMSVARGILYLHEDSRLMIIHRDLKASNILLDEDMNAKISDFGMARLYVWDESQANTGRIVGTFGYMAPEYAMHGSFSLKSDVYSYGVLILEIVSGKRNYYSQTEDSVEDLLSYTYRIWNEGKASDLIDPMLRAHSYSLGSMIRCIHIALLCVQENVGNRPRMAMVVQSLQNLTLTLPLPSEPGFFSSMAVHRPWLSEFQESASQLRQVNAAAQNEDTDSYLYPR